MMLLHAFLLCVTDITNGLHVTSIQKDKIPVWILYNYPEGAKKSLMELNLKVLRHNAPSDKYDVHLINNTNLHSFVPDIPEEYNRLPDNGARSDFVRAGLLAHHGGVYMDADVLFSQDLSRFTDKLADHDFVSYTVGGQNCQRDFSSNVIAARKGNRLSIEWWKNVKDSLRLSCEHKEADFEGQGDFHNGVCCKTPSGVERSCHIPWGGLGELTAHPIFARLVKDKVEPFKMFCFKEEEHAGFAPDSSGKILWRPLVKSPVACIAKSWENELLPSGEKVMFTAMKDGGTEVCPCWQPTGKEQDLQCADGHHIRDFFSRLAFHQFSMINGFCYRESI